jgi:hypothetical protein
LPIAFGKEVATGRERIERSILEVTFQGGQVLGQVVFEHCNADPVDARSAPVASDRLEGGVQQRRGDSPSEGVSFDFSDGKQGQADFS